MKEGYVVRRGVPFTFEILTSEPLEKGEEIKIDIQGHGQRKLPYQAKFMGPTANDEYAFWNNPKVLPSPYRAPPYILYAS
jgi:hypothetical protein